MSSPTQRTLQWLREAGWVADVVERWIMGANIRKDYLGFADIIAVNDTHTLAVQACHYSDVPKRAAKIRGVWAARPWLASDTRLIRIFGWKEYAKPMNGRRWRPIIREMRLADLDVVEVSDAEV